MNLTPPDVDLDGRTIPTKVREHPNPVQIDEQILFINDVHEDAVSDFKIEGSRLANAEADYKDAYHTALVENAKMRPAALRESMAYLAAKDEYRTWKLLEQSQKASTAYLTYLRSRCDSLRTIAANYRALTQP